MDRPLLGGCECGDLRYEVSEEPLAVSACHCTQCQRQSGSAFAMSMVVRKEAFRWHSGEPASFATRADSGAEKIFFFCPRCGTRIYNTLSSMPATRNVKPGTLDDTRWLNPKIHVWQASKQPWVPVPEDAKRFDRNPT